MKKLSILLIFLSFKTIYSNVRMNYKNNNNHLTLEEQLSKDLNSCRKLILILGHESYPKCVQNAKIKYERESSKRENSRSKSINHKY